MNVIDNSNWLCLDEKGRPVNFTDCGCFCFRDDLFVAGSRVGCISLPDCTECFLRYDPCVNRCCGDRYMLFGFTMRACAARVELVIEYLDCNRELVQDVVNVACCIPSCGFARVNHIFELPPCACCVRFGLRVVGPVCELCVTKPEAFFF